MSLRIFSSMEELQSKKGITFINDNDAFFDTFS